MPSELVGILMPAYNAEWYIGQAIESALSQTYPHWELVIVNDGSTDRTPDIVTQYPDPRIRVFHQANSGESLARNTALRHLRGELVAFLDADDLYLPNHLEQAVRYLRGHPDRGGAYTDGFYIDEKGARLKPLSSRRRGPFEGDIYEEVLRSSDVFGAPVCVVLRRDVITSHGLEFDPGIVIGPDWDFLTRYCEVAQFGYIDQPTCLYRVHLTNVSFRTSPQKRAIHLARCREKAIKTSRFGACSLETRVSVFYDLLVNLLAGLPERQTAITQWAEFAALPPEEHARLYRLMASRAVLRGVDPAYVRDWLRRAKESNPSDWRGKAIASIYHLDPQLCRCLLRLKACTQEGSFEAPLFRDLY